MEPVNPHHPLHAGAIVTVPATGTLTVNTGLREVQCFSVTPAEDLSDDLHGVTATLSADKAQLVIETWKATSDSDTTPIHATTARQVCWYALGK